MKKHAENKQEIIKSYEEKGASWLANKLYEERRKIAEINNRCRYVESQMCADPTLERQNEAAADVLKENGISPTVLVVDFIADKCMDCPVNECCEEYDFECGETPKRHIQTVSFWAFDLSGDYLTGIVHDFSTFASHVLSIRDKRGQILWKSEDD